MPRNPSSKCQLDWSYKYGTSSGIEGNLPEYKIHECINDIIDINSVQNVFPWVDINDFHFYHIKCPYSTQAQQHYVRNLDKASPDYWKCNVLITDLSDHTATSGVMIRYNRGSKYGWLCVDPNCQYYVNNGIPYFYI